jgi:hypothetical protein
MSAIINNSFRKFNADNFITAIGANKVYLMIGKNDPWNGTSAGEYIETSPSDVDVPIPLDTHVSQYLHYNDMIAAKLIAQTDVSHVLKRVDWTSGVVYLEYDAYADDVIDQNFFVFTTAFRVYKCIGNNQGAASTIEPTGTSTSIIETSDNYRWKFMFEVQQADVLKFVTTDWIPVNSPATANQPEQAAVESAAVSGSLDHISVSNGGTLYKSTTGTAQAGTGSNITLAATASPIPDYYNNMTVFISSGVGSGQIKTITDYDGTSKEAIVDSVWTTIPDNTSVYEVMPAVTLTPLAGDTPIASGAVARVSGVSQPAGIITKVSMVSGGNNYRFVTATVTSGDNGGDAATLQPRVSPPGGHGKNAVSELGGAYVMLNSRLIGNEGSDFPVEDDFRKVHLLLNPTANNAPATLGTYNNLELDQDSGSVIYTEFRGPIIRASDSTEDIKLVCEF